MTPAELLRDYPTPWHSGEGHMFTQRPYAANIRPPLEYGGTCEALCALVNDYAAKCAELEALKLKYEALRESHDYSCETPDPKCDCPGCTLVRDTFS